MKDKGKVVNFILGLNCFYKPKGSDKGVTVTTYVSNTYWITTAIAALLKKGTLVEMADWLTVNAYTDI